ncbi:hypothetical protein [Rubellicoccus peritrichatus]|uniref:Uncharacterized protein n=1 Tax=Rubellicoccus peritrichatus TaxID=3080537 RepID=A0AAQ3QWU6_9BACT|nr:hypothetical protein [Puniceicoccus sp. CR14]WOO42195.1 hypothetical protein RZN69_03775 [Puniceicoccus sp. CR14]
MNEIASLAQTAATAGKNPNTDLYASLICLAQIERHPNMKLGPAQQTIGNRPSSHWEPPNELLGVAQNPNGRRPNISLTISDSVTSVGVNE